MEIMADPCRSAVILKPSLNAGFTDVDVLCCKDRISFHHPGNVNFRNVIQKFRPVYHKTKTRDEKSLCIKAILSIIRQNGGNFLKPEEDGSWGAVRDDIVQAKVAHALRFGKQSASSSPSKRTAPTKATEQPSEMSSSEPSTETRPCQQSSEERTKNADVSQNMALHSCGPTDSDRNIQRENAEAGINEFDVLCCKDRRSFHHAGNMNFRNLVQQYRPVYREARSRDQKSACIREVISAIHQKGGRFLKPEDGGKWGLVSSDILQSKVAHALRISRASSINTPKYEETRRISQQTERAQTDVASVDTNIQWKVVTIYPAPVTVVIGTRG